jgi:TrmH family RNA methyltransferase
VREIAELPGPRVALVAGQGRPLSEVAATAGSLVIGAEREGLPGEVVSACDEVAHIPIAGDSLNAAMAATLALYEAARTTAPAAAGDPAGVGA